jgi:hypothetical protein
MLLNQWRSLFIMALCVLPVLLSAERGRSHWHGQRGFHNQEGRYNGDFHRGYGAGGWGEGDRAVIIDGGGNNGNDDDGDDGDDGDDWDDDEDGGQQQADQLFDSYNPDNQ